LIENEPGLFPDYAQYVPRNAKLPDWFQRKILTAYRSLKRGARWEC
jgi:hypothetical protein